MAVDISGIAYFMPIASFIFVMTIIYAVLINSRILGGNKVIDIIVSVIIALIFATMVSSREYVEKVTPWFVVLVVTLFFILIIVGLSQQKIGNIVKPWFVWVFIIAMVVIFLGFSVNLFFSPIQNFFIEEPKLVGTITLLVIGGIVVAIITKK